ncbi:MAG: DISARM system helicase DrmA, partial [Clostridium sp.]|nr:DISARM system helicase DrmA [Clostridium sp.]
KLNVLADTYERWISEKLRNDRKMTEVEFASEVGNKIIEECDSALRRIREGIALLIDNDDAFESFCFMNRVMLLQRNIMNYSKKDGSDIICNFGDFVDPKNPDNDFGWRPFQIAFILMNLSGIAYPEHRDRQIVDLLYFPTGGGKTEAYLGLMAFAISNRRLNKADDQFNRDGGVTAILRYTLRLLTTQQRDRITKMVVAAEMIRQKEFPKFGTEPISIGFWVGGGVTPNKFDDLKENSEKPYEAKKQRNLIYKQLLTCPFCGKPLTENEFYIDTEKKSVDIYCGDRDCIFYKYGPNKMQIPVYLVDEQIYSKCPTIILSTVDKFAKLPWDPKTNAIFGRVDRYCSRHGYVAIGDSHENSHRKSGNLPAAETTSVKPFLPPELIIQDELHLITGPLGTIYGAYETIIEDLCSYEDGNKKIKPKYVVSTATIKNAPEQTKCLYARKETTQFPPNGFEIGDSFFIKEIPVETDPFRKYVGVCAPGQSVKTTLLRTYAVILQTAFELSKQDEFKDIIDPYYTLVGYYNSIRELGGAVRLLQDDIPKRMWRLTKKYGYEHPRYLDRIRNIEITSRMTSFKIPEKLKQLETSYGENNCLDTAVATNMIAVGMDVDRLGLMVVTGQPKQNSEYIQATSRIGRAFPGLVVTIYNPYRPRDLSHYENFTGYHSQLYRFVEGTTATPFSARARDRVLHALVISAIRLKYPEFATNDAAANIDALSDDQIKEIKAVILDRLNIIKPAVREDADNEIDQFIDWWKMLSHNQKSLRYYVFTTDRYNRLMNYYSENCTDSEKATLNSMREVENAANMYYYTEG